MNWLAPFDIGITMGLIFAWVVLSLALAFRLLNFPDLTVEGSLPLGAAVFAVLTKTDVPLPVSMVGAVLVGAAAGGLTAFLHLRFRLNKFLAGIIVVAISYSLCLRVMGASNIGLLQSASLLDLAAPLDGALGPGLHGGTILLLAALLAVGTGLIISGLSTLRGMRLRVAGSNPEYARALGINVTVNLVVGLALTNGLAASAGVLLATHQGFVDVSMGQGVLIIALASMALGERLLPERALPFHGFVALAAILGSIFYQTLVSYAVRLGLSPNDLKLVTAVLVLFVVALRFSQNGELFAEGAR
jgi:putative ABC transport system permease protein